MYFDVDKDKTSSLERYNIAIELYKVLVHMKINSFDIHILSSSNLMHTLKHFLKAAFILPCYLLIHTLNHVVLIHTLNHALWWIKSCS